MDRDCLRKLERLRPGRSRREAARDGLPEIRWAGDAALFFGGLEAVKEARGIVHDHVPRAREIHALLVGSAVAFEGFAGFFRVRAPETAHVTETVGILDFPGVALLAVEANPFELAGGLVMDWITERP